jgi:DMSO/TMAO reductase YedYZ molybdopterin-dependent catalytic subunit
LSARLMTTRLPAELSQPRLADLNEWVTPVEHFYVRDHFAERPDLSVDNWSLDVSGLVERPLALSLSEIRALPDHSLAVTLECAGSGGHGRGGSRRQTVMSSMVGNAVWRGARVSTVLEAAQTGRDTKEVVFLGADGGRDPDEPFGIDAYARSIPIDTVMHPDTLLAYEMNGEPLTRAHGHPLRLVVPGWYGMDSVKWLVAMEATSSPGDLFYMQHRYRESTTTEGLHTGRMVREMQVKSLITAPGDASRHLLGPVVIRGWAWAGRNLVEEVLVSTDGGRAWTTAELGDESRRYAWRSWSHVFEPPKRGVFDLVARARDSAGRVQPLDDEPVRTYEANWVHRVRIYVVSNVM